jgi:hypothetical protein
MAQGGGTQSREQQSCLADKAETSVGLLRQVEFSEQSSEEKEWPQKSVWGFPLVLGPKSGLHMSKEHRNRATRRWKSRGIET